MENIAVIVPSLNPDEKLCKLTLSLKGAGFTNIIIVDDGSDKLTHKYFNEAVKISNCILLRHAINMGKGSALKTAFKHILDNYSNLVGAVTVDADGQHSVDDTVACAKALINNNSCLVMGCRNFLTKDIPARSRIGNVLTCKTIKLLCGISLSDTQTGLRGIPLSYMQNFIEIKGERFEYEMNMLIYAKQNNIPFFEVPIQTIYIEENKTSHFNPLKDSLLIYAIFFKFILSSIASALVDILAFYFFISIFKNITPQFYIYIATFLARVISSIVNFIVNKKTVFGDKSKDKHTIFRYYSLCIVQLSISAILVHTIFSISKINETIIKLITDTILFFISFNIQREWVFKSKTK